MAQDLIVKSLVSVPVSIRSAGMTEFARTVQQLAVSNTILYTDTAAINVFELPGNLLVTSVALRVKAAFDASGTGASASATVTVPNDTGTETVLATAAGEMVSTGFIVGTGMALTPASGGYLIVNYTPVATGGAAAGSFEVYMSYIADISML